MENTFTLLQRRSSLCERLFKQITNFTARLAFKKSKLQSGKNKLYLIPTCRTERFTYIFSIAL